MNSEGQYRSNLLQDQARYAIIGNSQQILDVKSSVERFVGYAMLHPNELHFVNITGETGTGKELVAKALWQAGQY